MLDDRKLRVLYAIIKSHILTAEPIGSRTISKEYDLGVSSATIRNEMSDLEDEGYLNKTHSSSGRIPSDKAYRLYVDNILKAKKFEHDEELAKIVSNLLVKDYDNIEDILVNSLQVLSQITSYTTIALTPILNESELNLIQFHRLGQNKALMVLVTSSGIIKNYLLETRIDYKESEYRVLSEFLNRELAGLDLSLVLEKIDSQFFAKMAREKIILKEILPHIKENLNTLNKEVSLYSQGVTKILNFPEYSDVNLAKSIISFIEDKEMMIDLLSEDLNSQINITIGSENTHDEIKSTSILTTTYKVEDKVLGRIGIIGPTRMDYGNLIAILRLFSKNISKMLENPKG